jgi:hypothetical protein
MSKPWRPHALRILDAIAKIARIRSRGDRLIPETARATPARTW